MIKKLHIISLDIPYPADYGGVIDIFFKLKELHKKGVDIILHCFEYGDRKQEDELKKYCSQVFYYKRITGWRGLDATLPYIISSRRSKELLTNLIKDNSPILFEGLHSAYYASHSALHDRFKILRAHNIESEYYAALAKNSTTWFKQLYYSFESNRLHHYENILPKFDLILSISEQDYAFHSKKYPASKHLYLPAFHPNSEINSKIGKGEFCLYHGNLSVDENIRSVEFLANKVFKQLNTKLIIAGKNPSERVLNLASENIQVIPNPNDDELFRLIQDAHINVLPSFQESGMKLKLLNALFNGRYCITNGNIETGLVGTIEHLELNEDWSKKLQNLMGEDFSENQLQIRKNAMELYRPSIQAQLLLENIDF